MATVTPAAVSAEGEQRFRLSAVSWETYELLLQAFGDRPIRITYDRGELELMSPSNVHEWYAHLFNRLISDLTVELGIEIRGCRSTTFRKEHIQRGLEPDDCYYIQNEPHVRGKTLDVQTDPPPDLAVEIDITSSSIDRMGIYAALKVPELWRFDGDALHVYQLDAAGRYVETERSAAFPFLPPQELLRFLDMRDEVGETSLILEFRRWVQNSLSDAS